MWVGIFAGLGGLVVGYMIGATRAHLANQRHLDELHHWIDTQSRRTQPPLTEDD